MEDYTTEQFMEMPPVNVRSRPRSGCARNSATLNIYEGRRKLRKEVIHRSNRTWDPAVVLENP